MSETTGAVDTLEKRLTEALSRVETHLVEETCTAVENITEVVSHLHAAGGERVRPLLVLLTSQLSNTRGNASIGEDLIITGAAIELTHLASLYHNDLTDDTTVRRRVTAAHMKWNSTSAVMARDLVFACASLIASDFGRELMRCYTRTFQRLYLGQMHNVLGPGAADDPIDFCLRVLREKIGSPIGTATLCGTALSGYSPKIYTAVTALGGDSRVAFQVVDNALNLRSTVAVPGKASGVDLRDGAKTLPILPLGKSVAAGGASDADRRLMKMIRDHEALSANAALSEVVDRLAEHRATRKATALTETQVERALGHLAVLPEGAVKTTLTEFSCQQISRLRQLSTYRSAAECTGDYDHPHPVSTTEGTTVNIRTVVNYVGTLDNGVKVEVNSSMHTTSGRVRKTFVRKEYEKARGYGDLTCIWNIGTHYATADVEIWYPVPL